MRTTVWQARNAGILDGLAQPYDLSTGISYNGDHGLNEAYDRGVNIGQAVARAYLRLRDTVSVILRDGGREPSDAP